MDRVFLLCIFKTFGLISAAYNIFKYPKPRKLLSNLPAGHYHSDAIFPEKSFYFTDRDRNLSPFEKHYNEPDVVDPNSGTRWMLTGANHRHAIRCAISLLALLGAFRVSELSVVYTAGSSTGRDTRSSPLGGAAGSPAGGAGSSVLLPGLEG